MEDIEHYNIPVYNFPYDVEEDDEETIQDNSELRVCYLLAVVVIAFDSFSRPFFLLPLLGPRRKLRLTGSLSVHESTPGVSLKSTTPNIVTSAD